MAEDKCMDWRFRVVVEVEVMGEVLGWCTCVRRAACGLRRVKRECLVPREPDDEIQTWVATPASVGDLKHRSLLALGPLRSRGWGVTRARD